MWAEPIRRQAAPTSLKPDGTNDCGAQFAGETAMCIIYSISDGSDGKWCILRDQMLLHDRLSFAKAIRSARRIARDEYTSTGVTATVEITPGGVSPFELSRFGEAGAPVGRQGGLA